jgi:very-short-patch-repair endonuclease
MFLRTKSKKWIKSDTAFKQYDPYKKWKPVQESRRSFFVWEGKYSQSSKEKEIAEILKAHRLKFYCEVSFDLIYRFDFYIPLIDTLFEYDGSQHFNDFKQMERDQKKDAICMRLGLRLIRYYKGTDLQETIKRDLLK